MADPGYSNILFAGLDGGVWRTLDGAGTWSEVGLGGDDVYSLTMGGLVGTDVYAGTMAGEVWVSTSGGLPVNKWYSMQPAK